MRAFIVWCRINWLVLKMDYYRDVIDQDTLSLEVRAFYREKLTRAKFEYVALTMPAPKLMVQK